MQVFNNKPYIIFKDYLLIAKGFIKEMQPQGNFSYSYNAAQAFNSVYNFNAIGQMAAQNHVLMSSSKPRPAA